MSFFVIGGYLTVPVDNYFYFYLIRSPVWAASFVTFAKMVVFCSPNFTEGPRAFATAARAITDSNLNFTEVHVIQY